MSEPKFWVPAPLKQTESTKPLTAKEMYDLFRILSLPMPDTPVYFMDDEWGELPVYRAEVKELDGKRIILIR